MEREKPKIAYSPAGREAFSLLLCLAAALFHLFAARGYRVYSGDQRHYLLLPFREIFHPFAPGDWLTWHTSHYHFFFSAFIRALHALGGLLGLPFEWILFFAYLLLLLALFRGLLSLVRALDGGTGHFALLLLAVFAYGDRPSRGIAFSFFLPSGYLVPSGMAAPFFLFSVAALFRGRRRLAFFLLGLAGLCHVNYGTAGFPLVLIWALLLPGGFRSWKEAAVCGILFLLPFLPTLYPTLGGFASSLGDPSGKEGFLILSRLAAPGHYYASSWPLAEVAAGFLPPAWGYLVLRKRPGPRGLGRILGLSTLFFLFLYLAQLAGSGLAARLFFWRVFPYLQVLGFFVLARETLEKGGRIGWVGGFLAAAAALFLLRDLLPGSPPRPAFPRALLMGAGILSLGWAWRRGRLGPWRKGTAPGEAVFLLGALAFSWGGIYLQRGYGLPRMDVTGRDPLCAWFREKTEPGAVVLVPPSLGRFRLLARRAVPVTFGQFPLGKGREMAEWKRRLERVAGVEDLFALRGPGNTEQRVERAYFSLDPDKAARAMKEFGASYFVTRKEAKNLEAFVRDPRFQLVHRTGPWLVFHFR